MEENKTKDPAKQNTIKKASVSKKPRILTAEGWKRRRFGKEKQKDAAA